MQVTKKFMLFLACVCILVVLTKTSNVYAKDKYLKENVWYDLTVEGNETDEYIFKVPENGYFYYEVVPEYQEEKEDSLIWWFPTKMTVNYKVYVDTSCDSSEGIWTSGDYSFSKGTKVKFSFGGKNNYGCIGHYKVRIIMVKPKNFEIENNNKREKANKLKLGTTYTGLIISDDTDWFVFTAPKTGKYKIYGVNTRDELSEFVDSTIYTKNYKILKDTLLESGDGWNNMLSATMKKGAKVYIKLSYSNSSDIFYKLKVKKVK